MAARTLVSMLVLGLSAAAAPVLAQPDPSGIEFVTIGAPGNAAWDGTGVSEPNPRAIGRGSVGYEYRIGKFEVTTAQWVEFFNAAYDRPQSEWLPHLQPPVFWGAASTTPNTPGGLRWTVPSGNEMRPTGGISWRMAAIYCNWLHNCQSADPEAFLNGAYDVSTFGYTGPNGDIFTDQAARSPGARYFIPTWDEWLKAAHFDPHRGGPDVPGWWSYSDSSDTAPTGGLPPSMGGTGEANYGFDAGAFTVPLGAYTGMVSPWGLYNVAGATSEWTESIITVNNIPYRIYDGSYWGSAPGLSIVDRVDIFSDDLPHFRTRGFGFRLGSTIPSPGSCVLGLVLVRWLHVRNRRGAHEESSRSCRVRPHSRRRRASPADRS